MEAWIVYDLASGEELYAGTSPAGTASSQVLSEGAGLIVVPLALIAQRPRDLDALRSALILGIDNDAERARSRFITALPGQVGTYWLKERVARRWVADPTTPAAMLQPEATARGMTLAELADEVIANAEAWEQLAGAIEGLRFGAKVAIGAATTIGAIVEAARVDWSVLDAAAG